MEYRMSGGEGEVSFLKKSVLDTVIVTQQQRIADLERQLQRSLDEMARLRILRCGVRRGVVRKDCGGVDKDPTGSTGAGIARSGAECPTPTGVGSGTIAGAIKKPKSTLARAPMLPLPEGPSPLLSLARRVAEGGKTSTTRYWTTEEHEKFLYASRKFGPKNYAAISQYVGTRNPKQVRTHAQKYEMRLAREQGRRDEGEITVDIECLSASRTPGMSSNEVPFNRVTAAPSPTDSPPSEPHKQKVASLNTNAEGAHEVPRSPKPTMMHPKSVSPIAVQALGLSKSNPFDDDTILDEGDLLVVPTLQSDISIQSEHLSDIDLDDIAGTDEVDWLDSAMDVPA
mmetsp:Transcript_5836/g.11530  ORF Transcript_5836/g.11530 Transcript_5836/m.11530 type:complete len:341 (+) Transcript_5836:151-1173(+)